MFITSAPIQFGPLSIKQLPTADTLARCAAPIILLSYHTYFEQLPNLFYQPP